ncbi:DUF2975 domain-containing protein [Sphingomonas canadensis]|uniref:DUF2975 domain-containing protein n=1 Tax=Sphingomonas canadensis TaxID=1219257 RepID=A0ABW3H5E5_9SPHN|nr:DUF2975 domain-containing protein [Sphingomonas canadensis]
MRLARGLRAAALAIAVLLPLLALAAMLAPAAMVEVHAGHLPCAWGGAVALAVSLLLAAGLVSLARMLALVMRGQVFAPAATRHFRRFALLLLLAAVAGVVLPVLVQAGLVAAGGRGTVVIGIDDRDLVTLLLGGVLFFVARLFDEAARLEEDSRSIV